MIIRAPRPQRDWYQLKHSIARDKRLSFTARGVLIYLLTRPDNWEISIANLVAETAESERSMGRDATYKVLRELENVGYLFTFQPRGACGRLGKKSWVVGESPKEISDFIKNSPLTDFQEAEDVGESEDTDTTNCAIDQGEPNPAEDPEPPLTGKPYTVKPYTGKPYTVKPTLSNNDFKKDLKKKNKSISKKKGAVDEKPGVKTEAHQDWENRGSDDTDALRAFLALYPTPPTSKADLRGQWFKSRSGGACEEQAEYIMTLLTRQLTACARYSNPRFVCKPESYLENEKWLDKIVTDEETSSAPAKSSADAYDAEYDKLYGIGNDVIDGEVSHDAG